MKKILLAVFFVIVVNQQSCTPLPPYCVDGPFQSGWFVVRDINFAQLFPYAYTAGNQYYCGCQGQPFYYDQRYPNYWTIRNTIQSQGWVVVRMYFDPLWGRQVLSY